MKHQFASLRDDTSHQITLAYNSSFRDLLERIRCHTIHAFSQAENEIPQWAISQLSSTCYEIGNRTLSRMAAYRTSFVQMTYREAEVTLRLIALTALKSSVRKHAHPLFKPVLFNLAHSVVLPVSRGKLPAPVQDHSESSEIYRDCTGSGTVYLTVDSILRLVEAVETRDLDLPAAGIKFVAALDQQYLLFNAAVRVICND